MDFSKLNRGEIVAVIGGLLLGVAIFLNWYESSSANASIGDKPAGIGAYSAWEVHPIMRLLLLAAAAAPIILAYIILRDHQLSWPRGQLTSVVAIAAIGLIFYNGVVDIPGEVTSELSLQIGWYFAFVGALLMLAGSVIRQNETETRRKPPGTI
ncbi:MAG: hypothetical protein JWP18_2043 [Solirubrobacterales bacterium]|nr:hypothetical protein [Solirubrobacterales bacterium]